MFINPITTKSRFSTNVLFTKIYVDYEDFENYEKNYHTKNVDLNMNELINLDLSDEPIYTLIWYDCKECKQLLEIMGQENKKSIYINASYYFYDDNEGIRVNKPLFYKDEEFISDDLFDIYEEIMK
jgi:hypothetical protein